MSIRENYLRIVDNVADAAIRSGRRPEDIEIVAVTKFVDIDRIHQAIEAGAYSVGENRVQEFVDKLPFFCEHNVKKNIIGQLQTNKVKYVLNHCDLIQSVDRLPLAEEISKRSSTMGIIQDVLIEVNIGDEVQKGGIRVADAMSLVTAVSELPGIAVKGLICIPPVLGESGVRKHFAAMRELFLRIAASDISGVQMRYLSMGMSGDYIAAIEEGSNMVRIGTALFGSRY